MLRILHIPNLTDFPHLQVSAEEAAVVTRTATLAEVHELFFVSSLPTNILATC